MPKRDPFTRKWLDKLKKVDRQSVQEHLREVVDQTRIYEEIIDKSNEGILVLDRNGTIDFINEPASTYLDIPASSPKTLSLDENIADHALRSFLSDHILNLHSKIVEDITLLEPREIKLRAFLMPLEFNPDKRLLLLIDCRMSSDQSTWDERLANIESLIKLSAGIAHEIGNPLNSISIHLQLLKSEIQKLKSQNKKKFEDTIKILQSETARLDSIIRNFLKATRKPQLQFRQDDLNVTIQAAISFLGPELKKHKITVDFKDDPNLVHFLLDRERLYSAFINIIKNSMESMPKGGEIKIALSHKKNIVSIRFKDAGKGISEKDLPHIFDTYFTTKETGSGLGLMTVFNSVREHGGRIEVDSKLRRGTTVTLFLPIRNPKLQLSEK